MQNAHVINNRKQAGGVFLKQVKKLLLVLMVCTLGLGIFLAGCQTSKKPTMPTPANQKPNVSTPAPNSNLNNDLNNDLNADKQVSKKAVDEAKKISGVRDATAVTTGKTIYIGLDLNANLESAKSAMVENDVLSQIKKMHPGYTVLVSSDIDTVTRIKKVGQGIADGKPISSFADEIKDIGTRMTPRAK